MIARADQTGLIDSTLLQGWRPPERLDPGDWASRHVELPRKSAIRGRVDHRNAPYLPGFMRIANAPGVSQLNAQKGGQMGFSSATRWLMGYWAQLDPGPMGLTLPNKEKGRKIVQGDVLPFFRRTKVLRRLMTSRSMDETGEILRLLNGFELNLMWAGSATSTASDPLQRVINDETDKMAAWGRGGGEGHAVHRTKTRLRTFEERGKQINISTPTTEFGLIYQLVENSRWVLSFLVPCPHCGARIRFVWTQVKFRHNEKKLPRKEWADQILRDEDAAWYECQACGGRIDEQQRRRAVQRGWYGTADDDGIADGRVERAEEIEEWPAYTTIGLRVSALYCMWESWAKIAHAFILAGDDLEALYTFITETLGEPFEQRIEKASSSRFSKMSEDAPLAEGIVPWWAACLIATIDTQKDHFWLVIRAWGPAMRSARVFHGRIETFEDLERLCFQTPWRVEADRYPPMACDLVLIDSGGTKLAGEKVSRTMEVYAWALRDRAHIRAIKGANTEKPGLYHWRGRGWYDTGDAGERIEVPLWMIDTHHYQDALADLMVRQLIVGEDDNGKPMHAPAWLLNQRDDEQYNAHMANLHKVAVQEGGKIVERWRPVSSGARVDLRDCEGYQVAGAYMRQIHLLPSLEDFEAMRQAAIRDAADRRKRLPGAGGITTPDGRDFIATNR